jgi:hypothetical protein
LLKLPFAVKIQNVILNIAYSVYIPNLIQTNLLISY